MVTGLSVSVSILSIVSGKRDAKPGMRFLMQSVVHMIEPIAPIVERVPPQVMGVCVMTNSTIGPPSAVRNLILAQSWLPRPNAALLVRWILIATTWGGAMLKEPSVSVSIPLTACHLNVVSITTKP
jgi:hypothetical protein